MSEQFLKEILRKYWDKFSAEEGFFESDHRNLRFFQENPHNTDHETISLKISDVNDQELAHANAELVMANHIQSLTIDEALSKGEAEIVPRIAHLRFQGEKRNFLSFASRYCNYHRPEIYPIYDAISRQLLEIFIKGFSYSKIKPAEIEDYTRFKPAMENLMHSLELPVKHFQELDSFFWCHSREIREELELALE